ncbi:NlpC/P60 family protein [Sphingobacterium sp. E70]|uniref:C40 family peptidase n=1 Tax=Sphingobacterium sp. E70 TaxID=2853439 RepID=UPI00211B9AD1|nr:NlpC/P60 family protein [Sphingobacterium sp. E70]ULT27031.1 NlpC/P60 family protein [Sphingobacterium sp. E70]
MFNEEKGTYLRFTFIQWFGIDRCKFGAGKTFSGSRLDNYASLLNVSTKKLNAQLYSFIDDWMGIPHRMGGQTKSGVDCSGFVNLLYIEVYKGNLPRTSRDMEGIVKRKKPEKLEEGDLVFFLSVKRN